MIRYLVQKIGGIDGKTVISTFYKIALNRGELEQYLFDRLGRQFSGFEIINEKLLYQEIRDGSIVYDNGDYLK